MLLYITGDTYSNIFDEFCNERSIDIKKEHTQDLSYYFNKNLNNLSHINTIAIELKHLVNDDEEIIKSIVAFRTVNSKIRFIIVSVGKKTGDIFLGKLFNESIFDFITSENETTRDEEIIRVLENENTYSSALKFRVENIENAKIPKNKKEFNIKKFELPKFKLPKIQKKEKVLEIEETCSITDVEEVAIEKISNNKDLGQVLEISEQEKFIEEIHKNNVVKEDFKEVVQEEVIRESDDIEEESPIAFNEKETDIIGKIKKIKQGRTKLENIVEEIKESNNELVSFFIDIEENRVKIQKDNIYFKEMENNLKLIIYYGNEIGFVENEKAFIDENFKNNKLGSFARKNNLELEYKSEIFDKLSEL